MLGKFIEKFFRSTPSLNKHKTTPIIQCKFLEAFPAPVFWLDKNKLYQGCNQIFADLVGFKNPSEIIGLSDKDLPFSLETLKKREEIFEEILNSKTSVSILYDCIMGAEHKAIWAQKRFTPLKDDHDKVIGIFGTLVDISEHVYRKEKIEQHLERKYILSHFIEELNNTPILSTECYKLSEKIITILKETSGADLAIWAKADASSLNSFVHFATDSFDSLELFKERTAFLQDKKTYGYLDPISINLLKEIYPDVETILFYRMTSKTFPIYDDIILLINPKQEKIQETSVRFLLTHHAIKYFHIHKFLTETKALKNQKTPH